MVGPWRNPAWPRGPYPVVGILETPGKLETPCQRETSAIEPFGIQAIKRCHWMQNFMGNLGGELHFYSFPMLGELFWLGWHSSMDWE